MQDPQPVGPSPHPQQPEVSSSENKENISTQKKGGEVMLIVGEEGADKVSTSKTSLQENFEKFRKQKQEQIKQQQYIKKASMQNRKSPEFKAALRKKFVEQAKKYFGVPYAARYWKPGEKHYNAPLYLDCCALVRRVLLDLAEDFGFTIGRWNQCYQFDTLPIDLKQEEMKPGDLVFYTATYYNDSWKPQKHDMVHVEIFYGGDTGHASIGARWQRGQVQIFDSYKFKSTCYYNIKFHYKSIDTWLEGICKSFCPDHSWKISSLEWMPGKKSIFASQDGDTQQDEEDMFAPAGMEDTSTDTSSVADIPKFYVADGNGEKFLREVLEKEFLWTGIPAEDDVNDKFKLKWTQVVNGINYFSFKEGEQLVNHIPNASVLMGKNMLFERMEDLKFLLQDAYYKPDHEVNMESFWPQCFRLDTVASRLAFYQYFDSLENDEGMWWARKAVSNWTGVKIIDNLKEFCTKLNMLYNDRKTEQTEVESKSEQSSNDEENKEEKKEVKVEKKLKEYSFIQVVPKNILTLKSNNNRCDVRCYMMVASLKPKYRVFMAKKMLFKSSFEPITSEENKQIAHITNFYTQKKHPLSTNSNQVLNPTLLEVFEEAGTNYTNCQEFMTDLQTKVQMVMRAVFETVRTRFQRKKGFFELFSFDFALTKTGAGSIEPVLMDIISNPRIQFGKRANNSDTKEAETSIRSFIPAMLKAVIKSDMGIQMEDLMNEIGEDLAIVYQE